MLTRKILLIVTVCLAIGNQAEAARFKKWVDENGITHYGTSVPPQYINQGHRELNALGIEVHRKGATKTPEERAREKELARLRAAQQRLLQEQEARDRLMLNIYSNEDEIIMTRDGKIAEIDAQIKHKHGEIKRLKKRLAKLQGIAANTEIRGAQLQESRENDLTDTQHQIENGYAVIMDLENSKTRVRSKFNGDRERYLQLKNISTTDIQPKEQSKTQTTMVDTAVTCSSKEHCDQLWKKAQDYAEKHATTKIQTRGERILMTRPPTLAEDISITVSRIVQDKSESIFLDLQCASGPTGQTFCKTVEVEKIRSSFRKALLE